MEMNGDDWPGALSSTVAGTVASTLIYTCDPPQIHFHSRCTFLQ